MIHERPHILKRFPRLLFRRCSARFRRLPDFIIVGAPKAGTTSLYSYLCQHPQVVPAVAKEVLFFDRRFGKGIRSYQSCFPLRPLGRQSRRTVTGEASPYYFQHPIVPERIAKVLPRVKCIVLLRDPVHRAWSHYRHNLKQKRESLAFAEALDAENDRAALDWDAMYADDNFFPSQFLQYSYVQGGLYARHLENWVKYFEINRQLLILESDTFFADPLLTLNRISAFLEIDDFQATDFPAMNTGLPIEMDAQMLQRLQGIFGPENERLFKTIGKHYSWEGSR